MRSLIVNAILFFSATAPALAQVFSISEEDPPAECPQPLIAASFLCEGAFCDRITVECAVRFSSDVGFTDWTNWVEADGRREANCADPLNEGRNFEHTVMTGLACRGGNCDDVSVRCTAMVNVRQGPADQCRDFTISDGDDEVRVPSGGAIRKIACEGRHCDNVTITTCPMVAR